MCVTWELNPQPFVLLTQCSTTEPQEHKICFDFGVKYVPDIYDIFVRLPGSSRGMSTITWSLIFPVKPLVQSATTWTT